MLKILCIHNNSGSRFYRINRQLQYMMEQGDQVKLVESNDEKIMDYIDWSDVIIFQMVFSSGMYKYAKAKGKKLIFECDDMLHSAPKTHYSYKDTKGIKSLQMLWKIRKTLKDSDGFICATDELAKTYGKWCKKTFHFPNYCNFIHWMKEPKKNMGSKLRILWAGSTSHTGDLLMVEPVMKRILDEYKDKVEFIYVGHGGNKSKDLYTEFIYGEDLFKRLPQNRESILPVPPFIWSYVLASLGADIAIAPLEKNYFNKFKSQCKYLEYAINGIPGVYSAHHYTDVKDYYTGITADSMEDFYLSIKYLIDNPQMREAIGKQAREDVINNFNLESHLSEWRDFIYDISGIKNPN